MDKKEIKNKDLKDVQGGSFYIDPLLCSRGNFCNTCYRKNYCKKKSTL